MFFARLATVAALSALAIPAVAQQLTISHPLPVNSHYGAGAVAFKEEVEKRTNNRIRFNIQRSDNERENIEALQIGTGDVTITSTGPVGNFVPESKIFDIPFLFRDYAHARGVLDSAIGQEVLAKFPGKNLIGMAWLENGFRNLTNSRREVSKPDDIKGMKIRTMENPVHMTAFRTLGSLPTPMAFSELVPALQQGTVDGQENPIPVIVANNLNQVQKFLSLTRHVYSPAVLIVSPAVWGKLNDADKQIFREAAKAAQAANRARVTGDEETGVDELRKRGMTVSTSVDMSGFQAAVQPAMEGWGREFGAANIDRIRNWR
jgi:tripartite ATP-independent transporter DctP family solute receptor